MEPGTLIGRTAWDQCESAIRAFEDAWRVRGDSHPDLEAFVAPGVPHPTRLLVELVHIDLEFRLRAGEAVRAEEYLARFPALVAREAVVDLLTAEFALRNRYQGPAWPEEFWLRFPEYSVELRAKLPINGRTGGLSATRPAERAGAVPVGPPVIVGYEILSELGRGGMGVVYKARDVLLHREVAVKTFATAPRADGCVRFAREAEAIARLDHPNIVPVYEVGEWSAGAACASVPYFAMKLFAGGSLDTAPAGPGTDPKAHARTVAAIARAVHHAHQRGVLHRDLKPSNILMDGDGNPHVADFGLAGRLDADAQTLTAVIAGTPAYMAPEQARDPKSVSTAADVYGLGAVLYHRLTGRPPFVAPTPLATLELVAAAPPAKPSAVNPAVNRDLDTVCLKCLEKDPARRYASAADLADDLERWRTGQPIAARPTRAWEYAWRRVRAHPMVSALAVTTLGALVGSVAVLAESNARVREKEREVRAAYLRECALRYKLEEALAREQRALYLERVASAGRLYQANQFPQAWAALDQCPAAHRGWEWRYLDSLRRADGTDFKGHTAKVEHTGFLPNGRVLSADVGGTVRVWDHATRAEVRNWKAGAGPFTALSVSPAGNRVALADADSVTVWDADSGDRVATVAGTRWAAFSPDGATLAAASGTVVRLFNTSDWSAANELSGHKQPVTTGAFSPDGHTLVTGGPDRTVRAWELKTASPLWHRTNAVPVAALTFAEGGNTLLEVHPTGVVFTDPATGTVRSNLDPAVGGTVVTPVGPSAGLVAFALPTGELVLWDASERRPRRVLRGHAETVAGLAVSPNHTRLASGSADHTVRVWDLSSSPGVRTLAPVGPGTGALALSPDGTKLVVGARVMANPAAATALVLDAVSGRELHRLPPGTATAFHPKSGALLAARPDALALSDPSLRGEVWRQPRSASTACRLAFSADGERLAVWEPRSPYVSLRDTASGSETQRLDTGGAFVYALAFASGGGRVFGATANGVAVWDTATGARTTWGESAFALTVSPNGGQLATADQDKGVKLRDAATGHVLRTLVGSAQRVNAAAFSPDGTRLVTGGTDRTVRVWDVESGQELLTLPGSESVSAVEWSSDGDHIYALDSAVRVWSCVPK